MGLGNQNIVDQSKAPSFVLHRLGDLQKCSRVELIISKTLHGIYTLYNYITLDEGTHAHTSGKYGNEPTRH